MIGPPGAGKGTQADLLETKLGIVHVASGELLREQARAGTPLGLAAKAYMERGELVPDAIVIGMIMARLALPDARHGVILDGFPRNIEQAQALDAALDAEGKAVDRVICLDVPAEALLARLSGRWTCRNCQTTYHLIYNPPRVPGVCDVCGGELYQRYDDQPEVIARRIQVYEASTTPLEEYYQRQGRLVDINGEQDIEAVHREIVQALNLQTYDRAQV